MMKAVILGSKGAAQLALDTLSQSHQANEVTIIGFIDDNPDVQGRVISEIPVLGTFSQLPALMIQYDIEGFFIGFSDGLMSLRAERYGLCLGMGLKPFNIIHKTALIAPSVTIGIGVFVGTGVMMEMEAHISDNCSIHMGSTIGHNCYLKENVWLSGGVNLAGAVKISANVRFGTGANVIPKKNVGENATVGAGAVVIRDVPDDGTVIGVPARIMEQRRESV